MPTRRPSTYNSKFNAIFVLCQSPRKRGHRIFDVLLARRNRPTRSSQSVLSNLGHRSPTRDSGAWACGWPEPPARHRGRWAQAQLKVWNSKTAKPKNRACAKLGHFHRNREFESDRDGDSLAISRYCAMHKRRLTLFVRDSRGRRDDRDGWRSQVCCRVRRSPDCPPSLAPSSNWAGGDHRLRADSLYGLDGPPGILAVRAR